jgi:phosphoribosylaminoimidazolecarboxamide formyltransferase/IMP cyclohydrolase
MDPTYEPDNMETRTLFGMQLRQKRNDAKIDAEVFKNIVTNRKEVRYECKCSLGFALIWFIF